MNLSLPHNLCLLLLDNDCGRLRSLPGGATDLGLAAAVLLELARQRRIDLDTDPIRLADDSRIGDEMADLVLDWIRAAPEPRCAERWLRDIGAESGSQIADASLSDLVERGIVERIPGDLFFLASSVELTRRLPPPPALRDGAWTMSRHGSHGRCCSAKSPTRTMSR